jgi:hypothetical protein
MASRSVATAIGNGPEQGEAHDPQVAPSMAVSRRIAGLVGPTLMALSASEALNYRIWEENLAPVTYLDGALLFVGGLSIVRTHNCWRGGWLAGADHAGGLVGAVAGPGSDVRAPGPTAREERRHQRGAPGHVRRWRGVDLQAGPPAVHRR